jgi:hypothetical protein
MEIRNSKLYATRQINAFVLQKPDNSLGKTGARHGVPLRNDANRLNALGMENKAASYKLPVSIFDFPFSILGLSNRQNKR